MGPERVDLDVLELVANEAIARVDDTDDSARLENLADLARDAAAELRAARTQASKDEDLIAFILGRLGFPPLWSGHYHQAIREALDDHLLRLQLAEAAATDGTLLADAEDDRARREHEEREGGGG